MSTDTLQVALGNRSYPIHFKDSAATLADTITELRASGRSVRAISDAAVQTAQPDYLVQAGFLPDEIHTVPAGETTKSSEYFAHALSFLAGSATNRDAALFAFGGGVVGDLAGFVAASYLRGIDFYQIPTTLLSMVDSSVGGKTGINLPEGKNLVGAFWQPKAVFIDVDLLQTLSAREFSAGMAEVIKYGMLADAQLFADLQATESLHPSATDLPKIIRRCCAIKAHIVADDEKETAPNGGRALLNLGHTFAHAIENVAGYGAYLHGEAVGIGLSLATQLSIQLGQLEASAQAPVDALLTKNNLPIALESKLSLCDLMQAMQRDKKNRSGKLRFVTMQAIGHAVTTEGIDIGLIEQIWLDTGAA